MNASVPLNDIVLAIERDVNSNKHKKDPFLPQYVDLTTSEYQQKENDSNFDTLSRNLKVRTSLITAQLSTLCKELDSVGSEAKGPGDRAPATKPTKDATACATIHTGAAVLAKLEKDIASLVKSTNQQPPGTVNASWAHWIERVTPTAEGDSATSPPGDGLLLASTPGTENNDTALYSNALASALQQLDAEVVLHVEETNTNPDHLASYMRYLRLIKPFSFSTEECMDDHEADSAVVVTDEPLSCPEPMSEPDIVADIEIHHTSDGNRSGEQCVMEADNDCASISNAEDGGTSDSDIHIHFHSPGSHSLADRMLQRMAPTMGHNTGGISAGGMAAARDTTAGIRGYAPLDLGGGNGPSGLDVVAQSEECSVEVRPSSSVRKTRRPAPRAAVSVAAFAPLPCGEPTFPTVNRLREVFAHCRGMSMVHSSSSGGPPCTTASKRSRSGKMTSHVVADANTLLFSTCPASIAQMVEMSGAAFLFRSTQTAPFTSVSQLVDSILTAAAPNITLPTPESSFTETSSPQGSTGSAMEHWADSVRVDSDGQFVVMPDDRDHDQISSDYFADGDGGYTGSDRDSDGQQQREQEYMSEHDNNSSSEGGDFNISTNAGTGTDTDTGTDTGSGATVPTLQNHLASMKTTVALSLVQMQQLLKERLLLHPPPSSSTLSLDTVIETEIASSHPRDPRSFYHLQDLERQDIFRLHEVEARRRGDMELAEGNVGLEIARQFHAKRSFMAIIYLADSYNKVSEHGSAGSKYQMTLRCESCCHVTVSYTAIFNS